MKQSSLKGNIALVSGATRGAGRGIAIELGAAGATVYVTGRSSEKKASDYNRKETIEQTAKLVNKAGGNGIACVVDHCDIEQMKKLKEKIENEQGHLDILVNDIWGGEGKTPWNTPIWEQPIELGLKVLRNATESHIITNHFLLPLLIKKTGGILFEISDGILEYNLTHYRCNNLFYDLSKLTANRLAWTMAQELKPFRCTSIGLTPGWLRSEMMLEGFGVTEENWKDAIKQEPGFINSETTRFVGRAIVNIAVDPEVQRFNGKYLNAYDASQMYDFTDLDGTTPNCWDKGTD